ncbi:glutathione S-transferase C-terminal domain-containing protein [bacterium]|nr:glutathione S-transferase C-terminal domain-containing protein [bacterium]
MTISDFKIVFIKEDMTTATNKTPWIIWGSELSPFTLKVLALCKYKGLPIRFLPTEGKWLENMKVNFRREWLVRGKLPLTYPEWSELDEFPLVPFLFGPEKENIYDSTAIDHWLDTQAPIEQNVPDTTPRKDSILRFLVSLIDEYADEFGLYLAHHYRWKVSATDNNAGERLAHEQRSLLGPARPLLARWFSTRQVRRLPYLFSVAPDGFQIQGLPTRLQPPRREGFPSTHDLLEESFSKLLAALEPVLESRPYLFGNRFTLADASIYGELGMNLTDPSAARQIEQQAPNVFVWLKKMEKGDFSASDSNTDLTADKSLSPLLNEICRTYVPLMKQNYKAYREYKEKGEILFNEKAFWEGASQFDGILDGHPFRSVVKTFQVKIWLGIRNQWTGLSDSDQQSLEKLLPNNHGLDSDV